MSRFAILLLVPFLPGYFAGGYESVTYTPRIKAPEPDVHAFKMTERIRELDLIPGGTGWGVAQIDELPVEQGEVSSQTHAHFDFMAGALLCWFIDKDQLSVVLYRPGYEAITIPSRWYGRKWFTPHSIDNLPWKPTKGFDSQLEALQTVYSGRDPMIHLSEKDRVFIAHEYERLAALCPADHPDKQRQLFQTALNLGSKGFFTWLESHPEA